MHISLDSALGRQKRLNSVGESVLQIAPDAAAAYSLRSLTGGDPDVVRVRRESDNTEKDFSGSQIESGEMARWVNEQPTLPLDLRELDTNTGERDGALIEAAAAYSLRKLKEDFTGDVVEVRRNVDGETEGFTAAEVTDGTMESFVKGWEEYSLATAKNYTTHSFEEFSSPSSNGFTALNSSAEAFAGWDIPSGSAGDLIEVSFDINIISGTPRVQLRPEYDDRKTRSDKFEIGTSGSYTATLKATGDYSFISFSDGDVPSEFTVSNFKVYNNSVVNELPLDQATGAAAAYSLRNLSSSYTGNVVEVRRSSDDAVKSFTASEVADGTLESWVNDYQTELSVARNYTINPYESFTNASSSGFTASNSSGTGFAGFDLSGAPGDEVEVSFELTIRSGSPQIKLRTAYNSSGSASLGTTYTTSGTKTITLTATADFGFIAFSEGDIPADFDVSNFQIVSRSADGHVKTWYDQSGSDNHAVQTDTAKQPKIVEDGTYLGELDFDGTDELASESSVNIAQLATAFSVVKPENAGANKYIWTIGGTSGIISFLNSNEEAAIAAGAPLVDGTLSTVDDNLKFDFCNTTSSIVAINGSSGTSGTIGTRSGNDVIRIGGRGGADFMFGTIKEIIIYDSDQTDNRRAIEENIANHYDISLAAFSRDGTVSTWYDQSGSTPANHATQTDPTKQPKIVDGGSLVSGGVTFDGAQTLSVSGAPVITASSSGTYSAFSVQTVATSEAGYLYGNASTSNGSSVYAKVNEFAISNKSSASLDRIPRSSGQNVLSAVYNNGDAGLLVNGAGTMTDAGTYTFSAGTSDFIIGNRNEGTSSGTYLTGSIEEIIIYNSDQSDNRTAIEANIGETYGITGIPAANDTVNGYVQTWYDQSGSGNDAEQISSTKQPKIVDAGSLVKRNNNPAVESTSDNSLSFTLDSLSADGQQSVFAVLENDVTSQHGFSAVFRAQSTSSTTGGANRRPWWFVNPTGGLAFTVDSTSGYQNSDRNYRLYSHIMNDDGGGTSTIHRDGTQVDTRAIALDANSTFLDGKMAGVNINATGALYMSEVIYYTDDQSSNRPAIEANIANQYGITLS